MLLQEMINIFEAQGYSPQDSRARVCQDIILKAISSSRLSKNVTVKGGVVMRSITDSSRRTTQDMDIDFIRYSLSDDSIIEFIRIINCLQDISIEQTGEITELRQQDYHVKSTHVFIRDPQGTIIESKIDFGVHKHLEIGQEEYCFESFIFSDIGMRENNISEIISRVEKVFLNDDYRYKVDTSDKRWLDEDIEVIFTTITNFLKSMDTSF